MNDPKLRTMTGFCADCGSPMSPATLVCFRCWSARMERCGNGARALEELMADRGKPGLRVVQTSAEG